MRPQRTSMPNIERKKLFNIHNISICLTMTFGITVEHLQKQLNDMFWPIAKLHSSYLSHGHDHAKPEMKYHNTAHK